MRQDWRATHFVKDMVRVAGGPFPVLLEFGWVMAAGGGLAGKHRYNSEGNKQSIDMKYKDLEAVVGPILGSMVPR